MSGISIFVTSPEFDITDMHRALHILSVQSASLAKSWYASV